MKARNGEIHNEMKRDGVTHVTAFSQYLQYSCSTAGISINELYRQLIKTSKRSAVPDHVENHSLANTSWADWGMPNNPTHASNLNTINYSFMTIIMQAFAAHVKRALEFSLLTKRNWKK
ncbi:ferrochelatase [Puccinia sorghi]|uniref:Ferrochelatase n=1 Tax=Puccinia sorghi TaxID=27349 RepID=A0A0L6ULQ7_9BASI|nr:ferrochelatase [Puccinia sorghi]